MVHTALVTSVAFKEEDNRSVTMAATYTQCEEEWMEATMGHSSRLVWSHKHHKLPGRIQIFNLYPIPFSLRLVSQGEER